MHSCRIYCWARSVSASARRTAFANSYNLNSIHEANIEVEASLPWHITVLNCLIAAAQPLCHCVLPRHLSKKLASISHLASRQVRRLKACNHLKITLELQTQQHRTSLHWESMMKCCCCCCCCCPKMLGI